MRRIGLLGGMGWQSTAVYYRLLNEEAQRRLGGLHCAPVVLESGDFAAIERLQRDGRWHELGHLLGARARALREAGAECLVICSNTIHRLAGAIAELSALPCIHIVEAVAAELKRHKATRVALLATRYTHASLVYEAGLERHGIAILATPRAEQDWVHDLIYSQLCRGRFVAASRARLMRVIERLGEQGAHAVILGCTELGLLVASRGTPVPVVDTTRVHAQAAIEFALAPGRRAAAAAPRSVY